MRLVCVLRLLVSLLHARPIASTPTCLLELLRVTSHGSSSAEIDRISLFRSIEVDWAARNHESRSSVATEIRRLSSRPNSCAIRVQSFPMVGCSNPKSNGTLQSRSLQPNCSLNRRCSRIMVANNKQDCTEEESERFDAENQTQP